MKPKYEVKNSAITCNGVPMLALVRARWGDNAPSHAELKAVEEYIGRALEHAANMDSPC